VAFVVGTLELTDPIDVDGVPLRIAHVPGKDHLTSFALEVGAHALRFFSGWFGIPYPSDKLDLIRPASISPSGPWRTWVR